MTPEDLSYDQVEDLTRQRDEWMKKYARLRKAVAGVLEELNQSEYLVEQKDICRDLKAALAEEGE